MKRLVPLLALSLFVAGCTAARYQKAADRAAYGAIKAKTPLVRNMDPDFTIEQTNALVLENYDVAGGVAEYLGPDGEHELGARVLRLEDALEMAVRHSRTYQTRKEQLYLSALSLTFARHQFTPLFSGNADVQITGRAIEEQFIIGTNGLGEVIVSDRFVEEQTLSGGGGVRADWLIRDVGRLSAAFTSDFLRFITGDPRITTSSQLSLQFVRPLLRNAGFKQQTENLIQAERNLLYDLRDFTQFRKDFTVQVARDYYNVLGRRDSVRNSFLNLQSSRTNATRIRELNAVGRSSTADLGRLAQQELNAESSWINNIRSYKEALDSFKILLGLSVDVNVILDDRELQALEIRHPDMSVEDAIAVALVARLDYQNAKDELEDATRKVDVARSFLKPQLDFSASARMVSDPADGRAFVLPDPNRYRWDAGLSLDPGFDRTAERNSYRTALLSMSRAARNVEQQEDSIKLRVRESWRALEQARRNYEISIIGVQLSERRVEEQELLAETGRANALNQIDAQNDLINSRNQLTQALVTHTINRLQFWNNMGILYIRENGQWEEMNNEKLN